MKFEIMSKWEGKANLSPEYIAQQRAIYGDDWEEPVKYILRPIVIDTKDIKGFNKYDDEYTTVRLYGGESISVAQPFEVFREVFSELTGETIKVIRTVSKKQIDEIKKNAIDRLAEMDGAEEDIDDEEDDEEDDDGIFDEDAPIRL